MAVTFVVETGARVAGANSYLDDADADVYFENHGAPAGWTGAQLVKQEALRMATQYLDVIYVERWKGDRVDRDQALDWPRWSVRDADHYLRESDTLPQEIKDATAEMALRFLTETVAGRELVPDIAEPGNPNVDILKVGPITIHEEFGGGRSQIRRFRLVDRILQDVLKPVWSIELA